MLRKWGELRSKEDEQELIAFLRREPPPKPKRSTLIIDWVVLIVSAVLTIAQAYACVRMLFG